MLSRATSRRAGTRGTSFSTALYVFMPNPSRRLLFTDTSYSPRPFIPRACEAIWRPLVSREERVSPKERERKGALSSAGRRGCPCHRNHDNGYKRSSRGSRSLGGSMDWRCFDTPNNGSASFSGLSVGNSTVAHEGCKAMSKSRPRPRLLGGFLVRHVASHDSWNGIARSTSIPWEISAIPGLLPSSLPIIFNNRTGVEMGNDVLADRNICYSTTREHRQRIKNTTLHSFSLSLFSFFCLHLLDGWPLLSLLLASRGSVVEQGVLGVFWKAILVIFTTACSGRGIRTKELCMQTGR